MRPSKAYKNWIRESHLNKYDTGLLSQIANHKTIASRSFYFTPARKKRLENIKAKVREVVKNDLYSFKDELTEEENFKLNEVVANIIDFSDVI